MQVVFDMALTLALVLPLLAVSGQQQQPEVPTTHAMGQSEALPGSGTSSRQGGRDCQS